jgi:hypothetical protein
VEVTVCRTPEQVGGLKAAWDAPYLNDAHATPFCSHAWITAAYAQLLQQCGTRRCDQRLVGVLPLAVEPRRIKGIGFRALVHGAGGMADYAGFLVAPTANARGVINRASPHFCPPSKMTGSTWWPSTT